MAACSGTIDTPTEENPPRSAERSQPPAAVAPSTTTPRTPAPRANNEQEEEEEETPLATSNPPPAAAVNPEEPAEEEEPPAPTGPLSFEADIWPIFSGQCAPCHTTLGLGGQNIGASNKSAAFDEAVDLEDAILSEIESGGMPTNCNGGALGDPGCLTTTDFATIEAWYEGGAEP